MSRDQGTIKSSFPIFSQPENSSLVYLDSAATTQKPQSVLDAVTEYYQKENANIHRGVYRLSELSSQLWESSRLVLSEFVGAVPEELIITRNTTEAINGVVYGWGQTHIKSGDVLIVTRMEHHSNFVPWQQLANRVGARLLVAELTPDGLLDLEGLKKLVRAHHKKLVLVALTHVSNVLGVVNPIEKIASIVRETAPQTKIMIDAAQSVAHVPLNFDRLDVDFLAFSGHKMYGPMGCGVLLVKKKLIENEEFTPWLFGGGMIAEVNETESTWNEDLAERFTAGTPDVASVVGLAAAAKFLKNLGWSKIQNAESEIMNYALKSLQSLSPVKVVGPNNVTKESNRIASIAFLFEGVHAHDVAQVLDSQSVAVRSGHHCTMPLHTYFHWPATVRASFGIYTGHEDVDRLVEALARVKSVFKS